MSTRDILTFVVITTACAICQVYGYWQGSKDSLGVFKGLKEPQNDYQRELKEIKRG